MERARVRSYFNVKGELTVASIDDTMMTIILVRCEPMKRIIFTPILVGTLPSNPFNFKLSRGVGLTNE